MTTRGDLNSLLFLRQNDLFSGCTYGWKSAASAHLEANSRKTLWVIAVDLKTKTVTEKNLYSSMPKSAYNYIYTIYIYILYSSDGQ